MRYKYAKVNREGIDFTLIESYGHNDGFELRSLIKKHDPINKNVILVRKQANGLNKFSATDQRKFDFFETTENFENLDWKESYID